MRPLKQLGTIGTRMFTSGKAGMKQNRRLGPWCVRRVFM